MIDKLKRIFTKKSISLKHYEYAKQFSEGLKEGMDEVEKELDINGKP